MPSTGVVCVRKFLVSVFISAVLGARICSPFPTQSAACPDSEVGEEASGVGTTGSAFVARCV